MKVYLVIEYEHGAQVRGAFDDETPARNRRVLIAAPFKIVAVFGVVIVSILLQGPVGPLYALAGYGFMVGAARVWIEGEAVVRALRSEWHMQDVRRAAARASTTQGRRS